MGTNTDFYGSLAELDKHLVRDKHYRVLLYDRASPISIIAPHGGYIERGTSHIASTIAGLNYNLFDFQGLRRRRSWELHITSVRFREPQLVDMLGRSRLAVSVHSMGTEDDGTILIGGLNVRYRDRIFNELKAQGFPVTTSGRRYRGVHPKNIVNLAQEKGVQVELTQKVIARMFKRRSALFSPADKSLRTTEYFDRFVQAVRRAIDENF